MIIIIYSVCPIFTNPPDWRKALSNGVKTHLFKLKISKISPTSAVLSCGEKMIPRRGGGNDWNAQYIPLSLHMPEHMLLFPDFTFLVRKRCLRKCYKESIHPFWLQTKSINSISVLVSRVDVIEDTSKMIINAFFGILILETMIRLTSTCCAVASRTSCGIWRSHSSPSQCGSTSHRKLFDSAQNLNQLF